MQGLEKILEEIEQLEKIQFSSYTKPLIELELVGNIIRKHMNDLSRENDTEIARSSRDNDGWIPVEEQLPEAGTIVIVTDQYGDVRGDIVYGYADEGDAEPCFHRWDDEYWQCYKPEVVAWQSLPELYRPERSKDVSV